MQIVKAKQFNAHAYRVAGSVMVRKFRELSIAHQLAWLMSVLVLFMFYSLWVLIQHEVNKGLLNTTEKNLIQHAEQLSERLDLFHTNLQQQTSQLSDIFIDLFPNRMRTDEKNSQAVENNNVPTLLYDGQIVNNDFSKPDLFTRMTGGSATIFVRVKDDFIRVSTSLRKQNGKRALGTFLGKQHPGYDKLINGYEYNGPAMLFGRYHMTKYVPFKDKFGKVIGILYVGFDYTNSFSRLKQSISKVKIGGSGGAYIVNLTKGAQQGQLIFHREQEGINISELSSNGALVLSRLLNNHAGIIHLSSAGENNGELDEMLAFSRTKKWNWGLVVGSYTKELLIEANLLNKYISVFLLLSGLIIIITILLTLKLTLKPIEDICKYLLTLGEEGFDSKVKTQSNIPSESKNEIHRLSESMSKSTTKLMIVTNELKKKKEEAQLKQLETQQCLDELVFAKNALVKTEKMSSLREIIVGVAHEINTPTGICITSSSAIKDEITTLLASIESSSLSKSQLAKALTFLFEYQKIVDNNLNKIASLVECFKSVDIQKNVYIKRSIDFVGYINKVVASSQLQLSGKRVHVAVEIDKRTQLTTYPEAWHEIISNLLLNSYVHGFENRLSGRVYITIKTTDEHLVLNYKDNGQGICKDLRGDVFDPFVTSKRGNGNIGLGMNLVFNLVTGLLKGKIEIIKIRKGCCTQITVPIIHIEETIQ